MQFNKVNNKEQCRLAARLSFKGSSPQQCTAWAHAHMGLQSHGCTDLVSFLPLPPNWLASPPPLPIFSNACQLDGCLDD